LTIWTDGKARSFGMKIWESLSFSHH
jgi:hypothetical protein